MRKIKAELKESSIEGVGVFTRENIKRGALVSLVEQDAWRYINHRCKFPNLTVEKIDGKRRVRDNRFRTTRDIQAGEELTINYQTLEWRSYYEHIIQIECNCPDCTKQKSYN